MRQTISVLFVFSYVWFAGYSEGCFSTILGWVAMLAIPILIVNILSLIGGADGDWGKTDDIFWVPLQIAGLVALAVFAGTASILKFFTGIILLLLQGVGRGVIWMIDTPTRMKEGRRP